MLVAQHVLFVYSLLLSNISYQYVLWNFRENFDLKLRTFKIFDALVYVYVRVLIFIVVFPLVSCVSGQRLELPV